MNKVGSRGWSGELSEVSDYRGCPTTMGSDL